MFFVAVILISVSVFFIMCAAVLDIMSRLIKRNREEYCDLRKTFPNCEEVYISVIVPCRGEEKRIWDRLENIYQTTLERDEFEVIIGIDGSVDNTEVVARKFMLENGIDNARIEVLPRVGKCQVINRCVSLAHGSIIISVDADTGNSVDAFKIIKDRFEADEKLGCCSSVPDIRRCKEESSFWNHEIRVRRLESFFGLMPAVTGCLYAYRKKAFKSIPRDVLADDMWIPMSIGSQGLKVCQDERLVVDIGITADDRELKRRRRVYRGGMECIKALRRAGLLCPWRRRLVLFLHKQAKWFLGFWLSIFSAGMILLMFSLSWVLGMLGIVGIGGIFLFVIAMPSQRYKMKALMIPLLSYKDSLLLPPLAAWDSVK